MAAITQTITLWSLIHSLRQIGFVPDELWEATVGGIRQRIDLPGYQAAWKVMQAGMGGSPTAFAEFVNSLEPDDSYGQLYKATVGDT